MIEKNCERCIVKLNDYADELKQLKQQLTESEGEKQTLRISQSSTHKTLMQLNDELLKTQKELAEMEIKNDKLGTQLCNADDLVSYLQQQLAEKEKEIKDLKVSLETKDILLDIINGKTKIEFAIGQLEKVQSYLKEKNENETWQNKVADEERDDIAEYIDNQIKQLKEGK